MRTYEFVAYEPITTVFFMRRDLAPGMKDATDIVKAKGLISGGLGATHARDLNIRLTLDLLEVPYRHVTGYSSSEKARLAMQRNEINFTGETTPGYRLAVESLVARGDFIPVFFSPDWNGQTLSVAKQVADLPILPFHELYRKINGRLPSGPLWDAYLATLHCTRQCRVFYSSAGRTTGGPCGIADGHAAPEQRPDVRGGGEEDLGYVPDAEVGADTNRQVRQTLVLRPDIKAFVAVYLKKAGR